MSGCVIMTGKVVEVNDAERRGAQEVTAALTEECRFHKLERHTNRNIRIFPFGKTVAAFERHSGFVGFGLLVMAGAGQICKHCCLTLRKANTLYLYNAFHASKCSTSCFTG